MALSAAEMVTLIREEIEARVSGVRKGSNDGEAWEHYDLATLRDLELSYQAQADADASTTGGLSLSTLVRTRLNADDDDDDDGDADGDD